VALELTEARFCRPQQWPDAEEASADGSVPAGHRGQNANLHLREAPITAFEAAGEVRGLQRFDALRLRAAAALEFEPAVAEL